MEVGRGEIEGVLVVVWEVAVDYDEKLGREL